MKPQREIKVICSSVIRNRLSSYLSAIWFSIYGIGGICAHIPRKNMHNNLAYANVPTLPAPAHSILPSMPTRL
ncbi:hypothetical protein L211DRAFT_515797 [Terfezia boudieri ATCC MYA-4762]|uniref:Uncharacterized protein n=1 Tax=Terfezia boudieri ATCC MYA-4762 TaxID=1051890 RepID=A0A3N4LCB0_9PEZI|nr:hypothetical protein L211DRAFT_515797 [Terfezia boudieri ATCC MYA-4762]